MDCLKRDIVMVLGNELLIDLEGSGEWGILCLSHHKCIILLVSHTGVSRTWSVFHIPLSCWFAHQPPDSGLAAVEMVWGFILSPPIICSKSNNLPSFTFTKMGHVYHICFAISTGQYSSKQCSDNTFWPPHSHSNVYCYQLGLPTTSPLMHSTSEMIVLLMENNEICRYIIII